MRPLSELAQIRGGYPLRSKLIVDDQGDTTVIQMKDVDLREGIRWQTLTRTSLSPVRKDPEWLRAGEVLFVAKGMGNYAFLLDNAPRKQLLASYHFFVIRVVSDSLLPEFLAWQINRGPIQRYLAKFSEGSRTKNIRRAIVERMPIQVPSIEVQNSIIEICSSINRERESAQALIQNGERMMSAIAENITCK
jgi:hypothetical protein